MMAKAAASGADVLIFDLRMPFTRQQNRRRGNWWRRRSPTTLARPCALRPGQCARQPWCAGISNRATGAPRRHHAAEAGGPEDLQRLADLIERWEFRHNAI